MPVKLRNESALGIFRFGWDSATGARCELVWSAELDTPLFSYWVSSQHRMSPLLAVRNPQRFGWRPPRKIVDFKAFAQRFADACEQQL